MTADPVYPTTTYPIEPNCKRCPELVATRTNISWGCGAADARLLVVGEAPAAGDPTAKRWQGGNHTGAAYTSRHSGRRIRRLVADLGYAADTYYTNAVKCFPADGSGSNREPTACERRNCSTHLRTEIDRVNPETIVPTGKHATQAIFDLDGQRMDGFLDVVLAPIDARTFDARIVPILHPSYQDVWRSRLGFDSAGYRDAIAAVLAGEE
ncbi:MAG: uracil-DNA glycosylase [Halobacteriota archaeon]